MDQQHHFHANAPPSAAMALELIGQLVDALEGTPLVAICGVDRQGVVHFANRACAGLGGLEPGTAAGRPLAQLFDRGERQAEYDALLDAAWRGSRAAPPPGDWRVRTAGGRELWLYSAVVPVSRAGQPARVFCMDVDVTSRRHGEDALAAAGLAVPSHGSERKRSEERTRHLAEHDFLTDLPNRVLLLDRLSLALSTARRKGSMLAILFLDLDRFKHINDTLGHQVGDQLLKEVAARLLKCVRRVDTVSRQGGDEFVIILADIGGIAHAAHVAATIRHAIGQPYLVGTHELSVSTSIGVSIYPSDGEDIDALVKNADTAMYHAKQSGRNNFQFFSAEMNERIVERARVEDGLRRALAGQQFELAFEPELDVASGALVGAEALLRWRHPELGLLLPERFLPVAEEAGLMVPIGAWVLREACRRARAWHDAGHRVLVAVNLSPAQFAQGGLVEQVRGALRGSRLEPRYLELELTEAILMKGGNVTAGTLQALRALGVRLSLDDFGTGWSRLGQLKDYPIDKLKIAQQFMRDGAADALAIRTIIALARSLDMTVLAEGVETASQLEFLRSQGCDLYQGYHAQAAVRVTGPGGVLP